MYILICQKLCVGFLGGHFLRKVFHTLCDYNLAWGLAIHIMFDDLDLISRSHVRQNYKLQFMCKFLSTVV